MWNKTVLVAQKFCWLGVSSGLGEMILWLLMALPSSLTVTLSRGEADSKDLRWLLSQGWCHGCEWPESWTELELLAMVPLHSLPSMASSGELDSSYGHCIPHSGCCRTTNHTLMSFCGLPSELTQHYFCHILLVKADTSLPRSQVKRIDSTSWWRSDLVNIGKERVGREIFLENKIWIWRIQSATVYKLYFSRFLGDQLEQHTIPRVLCSSLPKDSQPPRKDAGE